MSFACEAEVRVENEHALRFSIVSRPVPHLEYIRTISSLVGASHILAVFEEGDSLKVYFDDKKYVDTLIRSGIHVLGRHVRIDYVVPPGVKVVLSNVDPVITNGEVIKILAAYGTVVSPIIRPPISDDTELCHIAYGVRYVYMTLNGNIPNKIEFKSGDSIHCMTARVDHRPVLFAIPYIKTDDSDSYYEETSAFNGESLAGPSGSDDNVENGGPLVVNVENDMACSQLQIASAKSLKRSYKSRRGRPKKEMFVRRRKKVTATSQAAGKIRKNAKHNFLAIKVRHLKKVKRGGGKKNISLKNTAAIDTTSIPSSSESQDPIVTNGEDLNESLNGPYEPVLDMPLLLMFLEEVKGQRAPYEVVKKYLGDSCSGDTIHILCQQLLGYNRSHNDLNLKSRIFRLIRTLKECAILPIKAPEA